MVVFQIRPVLPPTVHAAGLLLFSGVLGLCGQVLITMGLQGEKAGRGSLVLYLQVRACPPLCEVALHPRAHH